MFCFKCGKQLFEGACFCAFCGSAQPSIISEEVSQISNVPVEKEEVIQSPEPDKMRNCGDDKSKFSRNEQTTIIGIAASLEATVQIEKEELKKIVAEGFQKKMPTPALIDHGATMFFEAVKAGTRDREFEEWNKEYEDWMGIKQAKIVFIQRELRENLDALDILYATTKLIPNAYRTSDKLLWLYEDMESSEHDIERAIDLLNHKETSDLLRSLNEKIDEVRTVVEIGFAAVYTAIQENSMIQMEILSSQQDIINNQHALLMQNSEMLERVDKLRKSARLGNYMNAGIIFQNYKRNKTLSQINNKI